MSLILVNGRGPVPGRGGGGDDQGTTTGGVQVAPRSRGCAASGTGRSGRTLVSRAVGSLPGTCSVGELCWLGTHGVLRNRACGRGRPVLGCEFWIGAGDRAFGGWAQVDATSPATCVARRPAPARSSSRGPGRGVPSRPRAAVPWSSTTASSPRWRSRPTYVGGRPPGGAPRPARHRAPSCATRTSWPLPRAATGGRSISRARPDRGHVAVPWADRARASPPPPAVRSPTPGRDAALLPGLTRADREVPAGHLVRPRRRSAPRMAISSSAPR